MASIYRTIDQDRSAHVPLPVAPARARIASRWPVYSEEEIAAVADVLRSGRVNALQHGDQCAAFEAGFAALCGLPMRSRSPTARWRWRSPCARSGSAPAMRVIVPARSFVASASCVVACGARPIFADIDPCRRGSPPIMSSTA